MPTSDTQYTVNPLTGYYPLDITFDVSGDPYGMGGQAAEIPSTTAQSNLAAAGYNAQLADIINQTNVSAQQGANAARLGPAGQAIQGQLLTNIGRNAAGLLDPQTERMLQARIAASGIGHGMGVDSPSLASAYTRGLGTNINALEQQALDSYLKLLSGNPGAPVYSPSQQLTPPGTMASAANAQAARDAATRQFLAQLEAQRQAELDRLAAAERAAAGRSAVPRGYGPTIAGGGVPRTGPGIGGRGGTDWAGGEGTAGGDMWYDPAWEDYIDWSQFDETGGDMYYDPEWAYAGEDYYDPSMYDYGYDYYGVPADTYYDPTTDSSYYDYGLGDYGSWDLSGYEMPADTYYDPGTDTSVYDYGLGDYGYYDTGYYDETPYYDYSYDTGEDYYDPYSDWAWLTSGEE